MVFHTAEPEQGPAGEVQEVHAVESGGNRNQRAYHGNHAADEHRPCAVFGEPVVGFAHVFAADAGDFVCREIDAMQAHPAGDAVQGPGTQYGADGGPDDCARQTQGAACGR